MNVPRHACMYNVLVNEPTAMLEKSSKNSSEWTVPYTHCPKNSSVLFFPTGFRLSLLDCYNEQEKCTSEARKTIQTFPNFFLAMLGFLPLVKKLRKEKEQTQ